MYSEAWRHVRRSAQKRKAQMFIEINLGFRVKPTHETKKITKPCGTKERMGVFIYHKDHKDYFGVYR
jgi:hypothetical protein